MNQACREDIFRSDADTLGKRCGGGIVARLSGKDFADLCVNFSAQQDHNARLFQAGFPGIRNDGTARHDIVVAQALGGKGRTDDIDVYTLPQPSTLQDGGL